MKKYISLLFTSFVIIPFLFGCGPKNESRHLTFSSYLCMDNVNNYELHGDFDFNITSFAKKDPKEFDINIAKLAFISNCPTLLIDGEKEPTSEILPSLSQLGFTSFERVQLVASDYQEDFDDLTMFEMATYSFSYQNESYQLFLVRFQGTTTLSDNLSNFDIGIDNETYMIKEGIHADWKNKENHKGYDVSANRAISKFDDYVLRNKTSNSKPVYLITGHSRGAAIANIVAKTLTDRNVKTFAYAFASPTLTEDKNAKNYANIFNFINTDDLVPSLPPEELGLGVYGTKKAVSIVEHTDIWNKFFPTLPFRHMNVDLISQLMIDIFKSRTNAYQIPLSDDDATTLEYVTRIKANQAHDDYENIFEEDSLAYQHIYVGDVHELDGGGYGFIVKAAPMFVFDVVNAFVDDASAISHDIRKILDFIKPLISEVAPYLSEILNKETSIELLTPHLIENYYPVIEYFK